MDNSHSLDMIQTEKVDIKYGTGKLAIINQQITEIPIDLGKKYGKDTKELSITFCQLRFVSNLEEFTNLTSLILDNNEIADDYNIFPKIPNLETLWINCNNLSYLESFLAKIQGKYPKVKYLSLLKNPCCTNYFVGKGSDDYKKYRATVLLYLPTLKFLDSSPVLPEEQEGAEKLRRTIRKPDESQYHRHAEALPVPEEQGLPKNDAKVSEKARFGKTHYIYQGDQSEGNRFIVDKNL